MLHLIRASAGAGKTHRLVYIYLQHLLASPTDIADIVVLSFTNKATQELKERILAHLHALAAAQKTSMAADLQRSLHYNKATLTQRAKEAQTWHPRSHAPDARRVEGFCTVVGWRRWPALVGGSFYVLSVVQ